MSGLLAIALATSIWTGAGWAAPAWDQPPPPLQISETERAALAAGQAVYRSELARGASDGAALALVEASPAAIWSTILDFDAYVTYMPYITASDLEHRGPAEGGESLSWQMELTTMGLVTRYRVDNLYHPAEGYMTWAMLPQGGTPLQGATGSWQVTPWGDGRSLVVYVAEVQTAWWVPQFVHEKAAVRLPTMVELIRKRVEGSR